MTSTATITNIKPQPERKPAVINNAIALLIADHLSIKNLFSDFSKSRSSQEKKALVARICTELSVHMKIEEEIFYPAIDSALEDKMLVPEATVEHSGVKDLIAQIQGIEPDGVMYDAKVQVLSEYIQHHIKEEQTEMFPKARKSSIDMVELGARMAARKADLLVQLN